MTSPQCRCCLWPGRTVLSVDATQFAVELESPCDVIAAGFVGGIPVCLHHAEQLMHFALMAKLRIFSAADPPIPSFAFDPPKERGIAAQFHEAMQAPPPWEDSQEATD